VTVPVIVVTGTVGVGKSAVTTAMHHVLAKREIAHACVDIDWLRTSWPERGLWNSDVAIANLASVWTNFVAAGAERLIIVDVVEWRSYVGRYEGAVPGASIQVCRLTAPQALREKRITARDVGESRSWHLARTVELDAILDAANVADFVVENGDRPIDEVATEVLVAAGWMDQASSP
jgi:adenylylsulfate kinase